MAERTSLRKRAVMKRLCDDATIVSLLDNPGVTDPYDLINRNIFPMLHVPGPTEEAKVIICTKLDYPTIPRRNDLLKNCALTFTVLAHNDHNTTTVTGDARTDLIVEELIEIFAFNVADSVFRWEPASDVEGAFTEDWYSRTIVFKAVDYNELDTGKRVHG